MVKKHLNERQHFVPETQTLFTFCKLKMSQNYQPSTHKSRRLMAKHDRKSIKLCENEVFDVKTGRIAKISCNIFSKV
jgi:hypothetical protein